jgi:hypothetical protein
MPDPEKPDPATGTLRSARAADAEVVEVPESVAEPGGPPARVDAGMVNEETAAQMRPLVRDEGTAP